MKAADETVTMYDNTGAQVQVPQPMTTMFVMPNATRKGDEVILPADKRYVVLSKLAAHNGNPRTENATMLVRRPFRGVIR